MTGYEGGWHIVSGNAWIVTAQVSHQGLQSDSRSDVGGKPHQSPSYPLKGAGGAPPSSDLPAVSSIVDGQT